MKVLLPRVLLFGDGCDRLPQLCRSSARSREREGNQEGTDLFSRRVDSLTLFLLATLLCEVNNNYPFCILRIFAPMRRPNALGPLLAAIVQSTRQIYYRTVAGFRQHYFSRPRQHSTSPSGGLDQLSRGSSPLCGVQVSVYVGMSL